MTDIFVPKNPIKFLCEICNYKCSNKKDYNKHLKTNKHFILTQTDNFVPKNPIFFCVCGKSYLHRQSLYNHKKKCSKETNNSNKNNNSKENNNSDEITEKELIQLLVNQTKDLMDIVKNGTNNTNHSHNTTTTNSHNKSFNLNFFLNETCKNAMDMSKFVSLIQPTLEDLEKVGRVGYAEGISSIINNKLKVIDVTERPFHCSDLKREVFHIKENGEWNKEAEDKPLLTSAIKKVAYANMSNILNWSNKYPESKDSASKKNIQYLNIVTNSMSGSSKDETNKNMEKIITNISKTVIIDK